MPANRKLTELVQLKAPCTHFHLNSDINFVLDAGKDYVWRPLVFLMKALTELSLGNTNSSNHWKAKIKGISTPIFEFSEKFGNKLK